MSKIHKNALLRTFMTEVKLEPDSHVVLAKHIFIPGDKKYLEKWYRTNKNNTQLTLLEKT